MFFKVVFLVISISTFSSFGFSQLRCHAIYSPFDHCRTDYGQYNHIYFGEIEAIEPINRSVNGVFSILKIKVRVISMLKGEMSTALNIYVSSLLHCYQFSVGDQRVFFADDVRDPELKGVNVHYSQNASYLMNDYSIELKAAAIAGIRNTLENRDVDYVEGIVIERKKFAEETIKGYDIEEYAGGRVKAAARAFIKAEDQQTGKTYSTKSRDDGTFRIGKIPDGKYAVSFKLDGNDEWRYLKDFYVSSRNCTRNWFIAVAPEQISGVQVHQSPFSSLSRYIADEIGFWPGISRF